MQELYSYFVLNKYYKEKTTENIQEILKKSNKDYSIKKIEDILENDSLSYNIDDNITKIISDYKNKNHIRKQLLNGKVKKQEENIIKSYLFIFHFLIEWKNISAENLKQIGIYKSFINSSLNLNNFVNNRFLISISKNGYYQNFVKKNSKNIDLSSPIIIEIYNKLLKNDEKFIKYCNLKQTGEQEDSEILTYIVKNIIYKNETTLDFLNNVNPNWDVTKGIISILIIKTIKNYIKSKEKNIKFDTEALGIITSKDFLFFKTLVHGVIENEEKLIAELKAKIENWDIDRIIILDKIIILMAAYELLYIKNIPFKVTIDEYLDISKKYSTPKSKLFINGVLDALANQYNKQEIANQ